MPMHEQLNVIVVGCGEPKKSMGWFHITQLMTDPDVQLAAIVEPWCAESRWKPPSTCLEADPCLHAMLQVPRRGQCGARCRRL